MSRSCWAAQATSDTRKNIEKNNEVKDLSEEDQRSLMQEKFCFKVTIHGKPQHYLPHKIAADIISHLKQKASE